MEQLIYDLNKELNLKVEMKENWIMTEKNKPEFIILCQSIPLLEEKIYKFKLKAGICE